VQGVGFRYFLMRERSAWAARLGEERDDGTVVRGRGGGRSWERLRQAAERGPRMAQVKRVDRSGRRHGGLDSFD